MVADCFLKVVTSTCKGTLTQWPIRIQNKRKCATGAKRGKTRACQVAIGSMYLLPNSDWLIGLSTSVMIGQSNYFGFGFTTAL